MCLDELNETLILVNYDYRCYLISKCISSLSEQINETYIFNGMDLKCLIDTFVLKKNKYLKECEKIDGKYLELIMQLNKQMNIRYDINFERKGKDLTNIDLNSDIHNLSVLTTNFIKNVFIQSNKIRDRVINITSCVSAIVNDESKLKVNFLFELENLLETFSIGIDKYCLGEAVKCEGFFVSKRICQICKKCIEVGQISGKERCKCNEMYDPWIEGDLSE